MQMPTGPLNFACTSNSACWTHLCSEKEFWNVFSADLNSCSFSLVIVSPFVTNDATWKVVGELNELKRRNVRITIYTRPPEEQQNRYGFNLARRRLEKLGVDLRLVSKIHQKLAVIDDTTWWEGDLNILGSRDWHAQMRRFQGKEARHLLAELSIE